MIIWYQEQINSVEADIMAEVRKPAVVQEKEEEE
jgi:hypothetical protein